MTPLLGAESRELKPVVSSECSNDLRGNDLPVDVGQRDLKDNQFAFLKGIGHESSQASLTQIARPTLEVQVPLSSPQANIYPCLEAMPG
jgi:hypothetical protein